MAATVAVVLSQSNPVHGDSWKDKTIAPVTNPLFFEAAQINSEIRPIFIHHNIPSSFAGGAGKGDAQVYAVQARWAVNDRLAIIATKDGYVDVEFDNIPALSNDGWADIAFGLKYALIDNEEDELLVTPGLKIELPSGESDVFQNNGSGEWNLFVTAMKGYGDLHLTGSAGVRIPNDFDEETASAHFSAQVDYYTCKWFIPFAAFNAFSVLSDGDDPYGLGIGTEGFDLINFGSRAEGETYKTVGFGFRSKVHENVDLGFAYEIGVGQPEGIFDDRYTVDMIISF